MFINILTDATLWIMNRYNVPPTLAEYHKVAILRWDWLVNQIQDQDFSNIGDNEYQTKSFKSDIELYRQSGVNPLKNKANFFMYKSILSQYRISQLGFLSNLEQTIINDNNNRVSLFNESDFRDMLSSLRQEISKANKYINLHSSSSSARNQTVRHAILSDLEQISAAMELEDVIEQIIFTLIEDSPKKVNLISNAESNVSESDISFNLRYKSTVAVPFERSLEFMSHKFLGTPDRWLELVAINELKPPYLDLKGEKVLLIANATASSIQVPYQYKNKLRVNQKIIISSSLFKKPKILKITNMSVSQESITLEFNEEDLTKYKKRDMAYIKIYKPHTVQESSFILIPTEQQLEGETFIYSNPNIQELDRALQNFGTDVKTSGCDWSIENGDLGLNYGVSAVRQSVESVLQTFKTDNKWHTNYGISDAIGSRYIGFDQATSIAASVRDSILMDRRFTRVLVRSIAELDVGISINLVVFIRGYQQGIPLSFIG